MDFTFYILKNISKILIVLASSYFIGSLLFNKKSYSSANNSIFYIGTGLGVFILVLTILGYLGLLFPIPLKIVIYLIGIFSIYNIFTNFRIDLKLIFINTG